VLWRFRAVQDESGLIESLRKLYDGRAETVQLRAFRVAPYDSGDYLAMAELCGPTAAADLAALGKAAKHADLVNTYMTYSRQAPGAFPKTS
jgi:hypothetical protein